MTKRILLAEDDDDVRLSLRLTLEAAGYQIDEVPDGESALAQLGAQTYDLLLTDLWMPHVGGVELLKQIRTAHPKLRVVVISGGGGPSAPLDFSDALARTWGADAVLHKPVTKNTLLGEIERILVG